jgi:hypothetical protein
MTKEQFLCFSYKDWDALIPHALDRAKCARVMPIFTNVAALPLHDALMKDSLQITKLCAAMV